jgi:hypothetical protein
MVAAIGLVVAACGSSDSGGVEPSATVALLPDLVPAAPVDIHTINEDGVDLLRFTSTLVNVGTGDFLLRGTRSGPESDDWAVQQEIPRSSGPADVVPTDAVMAWGGDGHDHWHVARVADYRLVKTDDEGNEVDDVEAQVDTKVGFCFYDSGRQLERIGPDEAVYSHETCGHEDDTEFAVGLSIGWGDTYHWLLPGQAFDITDVPDGSYRLWAQADGSGWFQEANRDNNVTWVDLELSTLPGPVRAATITAEGPEPG